ncbi:MAG: outer membrane protein transport protein, partial [Desulfobacterales bacterium]
SIIPGLFAIYKKDRWAGYFGMSNVVGGGKVEFDDGLATTHVIGTGIQSFANANLAAGLTGLVPDPSIYYYTGFIHNFKGEHVGLGYTFGGAYKINDMFSIALAARYVDTEKKLKGGATISATNLLPGFNDPINVLAEFEEDAQGWGGVIGLNISPNDQLNIGIRYETRVDLDYDADVKQDTHGILSQFDVIDGGERERNLPAIFAIGASYQVNAKIRLETNLTYYLNKDASFDDLSGTSQDESDVDNGFDLGIAFEYAFSDTLKGSVGYLYTETGVDAEDMTPWLPELGGHTLGAGLAWEVVPNLDLNFGILQCFYQDEDFIEPTTSDTIKYEKDITLLAFGVQYKFM